MVCKESSWCETSWVGVRWEAQFTLQWGHLSRPQTLGDQPFPGGYGRCLRKAASGLSLPPKPLPSATAWGLSGTPVPAGPRARGLARPLLPLRRPPSLSPASLSHPAASTIPR